MFEIARVMMLIQIPIIISIIVIGLQAMNLIAEHKIPFKLIIAGWFGNLLYICLKFHSGSYTETIVGLESIITLTGLFSTYCFYLAGAVYFSNRFAFSYTRNSIVAAIFLGAAIVKIYTIAAPVYLLGIFNPGNLLVVFCNLFALIVLTLLFNDLAEQYPGSKILFIGTLTYALAQLFDLLSYNVDSHGIGVKYAIDTGIVLGFICKFMILSGFSVLTIQTAKYSSKLEALLEASDAHGEKMRSILGRTFHEVNPPLLDIENSLSTLSSDNMREDGIVYNKKTAKEIEKIDQALFRTKTILAASVKIYLSEESRYTNLDHSTELPFQIEEKRDVYNLNTLIEIAIINFKSKLLNEYGLNNFEHNVVKFHTQYGKNCNLYCNSVQIVQVYYNLFKNSYEAFNGLGRICNIHVKTKIEKVKIENNHDPDGSPEFILSKKIRVEIQDDGPGIDEEILPRIFDLGFSTKENKEVIKGYGLDIVKTFTEDNNGTIEVISNNTAEAGHKSGTTFIFQYEID